MFFIKSFKVSEILKLFIVGIFSPDRNGYPATGGGKLVDRNGRLRREE